MRYRKKSVSIFEQLFASIDKSFILGGRMCTRLQFYLISQDPKSETVGQLMKQLVYTISITNNHTSFRLWGEKNLLKYPKVSKHYDHNCKSFL